MAFDFKNDPKLKSALPAALLNKMQATQEARIANGNTSTDGETYRTKEKADFMSDVHNWKQRGRPESELDDLKEKQANLVEKGLF